MRVGVVHMTTEASSGDYSALIESNLDHARQDDTELLHRYVARLRRATDSAQPYPMMLNQADIVDEVLGVARDGADAVLIACSGDPAVAEGQSIVSIPVVGALEATLGVACGYGWKFGLVTVDDRTWSVHLDQLVHAYRFDARYVGMRKLHTPTAEIFTDGFSTPRPVIDDLTARSCELVEDGADVGIIGSGGLCAFATHFGVARVPELDVPILDSMAVGLKVAEMRAELTARLDVPAASRAGWTGRLPDRDVARVRALFAREDVQD